MSSIFIQLAYMETSLPFVCFKLCLEECHAGKMPQQLRTLVKYPSPQPFVPDPQGRRTELTPAGCPLTSTPAP